MRPSRDPDSKKYRDDPTRTFYCGRWRTSEKIQQLRETTAARQRERTKTPGTRAYQRSHGLGIPGAKRNLALRLSRRILAGQKDQQTAAEILAKYPELKEVYENERA